MEEALKLLLSQSGVKLLDGYPLLAAVPEGWRIESLEQYGTLPTRIKQSPVLRGIDTFTTYVNRFKNDGSTIFVVPDLKNLAHGTTLASAIIDYHKTDVAAWGDHVVTMQAAPSLAYEKLMKLDNQLLAQDEFAKALEEIARFSNTHDQAELVEIARTINLTSKGAFKSIDDEFSGSVEFQYDVQVKANAGTTVRKLQVPQEIGFDVALIDGMPSSMVGVRFLYRVPDEVGGKVKLGIKIIDRTWLEEAAIAAVREKLATDTGLDVFTGKL